MTAWEREATTVRDIHEALLERRKVVYITVITMMKILERKIYLKTLADRAYVYRRPTRYGMGLLACRSAFYSLSPKLSYGFGVKSR